MGLEENQMSLFNKFNSSKQLQWTKLFILSVNWRVSSLMHVGTIMKFCISITTNFLHINGTKRYRYLKYLKNCNETTWNNGVQDVGKMKTHTNVHELWLKF